MNHRFIHRLRPLLALAMLALPALQPAAVPAWEHRDLGLVLLFNSDARPMRAIPYWPVVVCATVEIPLPGRPPQHRA
jgi:hypothetical protein